MPAGRGARARVPLQPPGPLRRGRGRQRRREQEGRRCTRSGSSADIGPIVNLSSAENQCQGSVIDALSTAMGLKITFEGGKVGADELPSSTRSSASTRRPRSTCTSSRRTTRRRAAASRRSRRPRPRSRTRSSRRPASACARCRSASRATPSGELKQALTGVESHVGEHHPRRRRYGGGVAVSRRSSARRVARASRPAAVSAGRLCEWDPDIDAGRVRSRRRVTRSQSDAARSRGARGARCGSAASTVSVDVVWDHLALVPRSSTKPRRTTTGSSRRTRIITTSRNARWLTNVDWPAIRQLRRAAAARQGPQDRRGSGRARGRRSVEPARQAGRARWQRIYTFAAELARSCAATCTSCTRTATPLGAELPVNAGEADRRRASRGDEALSRHTHAALEGRPASLRGHGARALRRPHEVSTRPTSRRHAAPWLGAACNGGCSSAAPPERVLDRLPCDLVIIKPLEFEAPDCD